MDFNQYLEMECAVMVLVQRNKGYYQDTFDYSAVKIDFFLCF